MQYSFSQLHAGHSDPKKLWEGVAIFLDFPRGRRVYQEKDIHVPSNQARSL